MNVFAWIVQGLLVLVFGYSAIVKGTKTPARAVELGMTGVADVPLGLMRFTAACEALGVIGLILPHALGIVPVLTPLAAGGLGLIMVPAAWIHLRRAEPLTAVGNVALLGMCLIVMAVRWPA